MDNFNFDTNVSYQYEAKKAFLQRGRRQLRRVARAMGLVTGQYEVRVNRGGIAVSGEVTLHTDLIYCQLFQSCLRRNARLMYRTCEGRKDYCGGQNNFLPGNVLNDADKVARILTTLQCTGEVARRARDIEAFERWRASEPHDSRDFAEARQETYLAGRQEATMRAWAERVEDDRLMDDVVNRAAVNPSHFLLSIIGHLDGLMIAKEFSVWHHSMVTGKLWAIYIHIPTRWKGLEV